MPVVKSLVFVSLVDYWTGLSFIAGFIKDSHVILFFLTIFRVSVILIMLQFLLFFLSVSVCFEHELLIFRVFPDKLIARNCQETKYGCCPDDGAIAALGPDGAGCPS